MDYLLKVNNLNEWIESRVEDAGRSIDLDFIGHDCRHGGSRSDSFCDAFSPIEQLNQFTVHAIEGIDTQTSHV